MYKKFAVVAVICSIAALFVADYKPARPPDDNLTVKSTPVPKAEIPAALAVINLVNQNNDKITSISGPLEIKTQRRFIHLTGTLSYQKDKMFHMQVNSGLGKELDMGSNNDLFWFCSKRYQNGGVFYCRHDEFQKSRLKTPFNPTWMMNSLGFSKIETADAEFSNYQSNVVVNKKIITAGNEALTVMILVSPFGPRVLGYYLYDQAGNPVAHTKVIKYDGINPKRWGVSWSQEDVTLEFELINPKINEPIDDTEWRLPAGKRLIDMAKN